MYVLQCRDSRVGAPGLCGFWLSGKLLHLKSKGSCSVGEFDSRLKPRACHLVDKMTQTCSFCPN